MAGGEFCGNATRAAAIVFSELDATPQVEYQVSGYEGIVKSTVKKLSNDEYEVKSTFANMPIIRASTIIRSSDRAQMVDLGGITHVLINAELPTEYETRQREIVRELNLSDRSAVGVIWYQKSSQEVAIQPIVWVKSIDTLFYETSCGSGAIATSVVTGITRVIQPTGEPIFAYISGTQVTLKSRMRTLSSR